MGRANARWLGSIPNRLTNLLNTHTTNQGVKMIRSFACDYETLKRLAEIERARAIEAERKETFDSAFNFAIKLTVAVETGRLGLLPSEYREAHNLLEVLNQFAKHLL